MRNETRWEIDRLIDPGDQVFIVGGEPVIYPEVKEELIESGFEVTRLAGENRYETAIAVASLPEFEVNR